MSRDPASISDIYVAAQRIQDFVRGMTREEFEQNDLTQSAVLYQISVIGEAVWRLSDQYRDSRPDIPWHALRAMRNIVVHNYNAINTERIWAVAEVSAAELMTALRSDLPQQDHDAE